MDSHTIVPGYRGALSAVQILPEGDPSLPQGPDLVAMATRALGYLARNPDPEHNLESRFTFFPHLCPPFAPEVTANLLPGDWKMHYTRSTHIDPVAIGDTESRNDIAFNLMREMAGSDLGRHVQEQVHRRLVGYIRSGSAQPEEDLCWAIPYASFANIDDGPYAMVGTTGMLLHSEADLFRLTGDDSHRVLARRLFEGLRRVASWGTGRAFYHFGGAVVRNGVPGTGYSGHYPWVISPAMHYALACGDPEALAFAEAMAEGFLCDLQPGHLHKADGHIHGHTHSQMHAIRGVAMLGALRGNWRLLDWVHPAYNYNHASGLDSGWVPEIQWEPGHRTHSETCLVADMLEIEVWLARAGQPHLWDRVDRTVRNYLAPAQFALTAEFEAFWREVNAGRSEAELARGLAGLRELEGGFLSSFTPVDRAIEVPAGAAHQGSSPFRGRHILVEMAGCCPPSGMRALHLAWANAVLLTPSGIMVNLPFDHDGPEAKVRSGLPGRGHLSAVARVGGDFFLRPPSWAPRQQVRARRNGQAVAAQWGGPALAYITFPAARPGERLELAWPLVRFRQRVTQQFMPDSAEEHGHYEQGDTYTFEWLGSTILGVDPPGKLLPLYRDIDR